MKKVNLNNLLKKVSDKDRHVRWNWERSPDSDDMVRYHFVVVDDKYRQEKMNRLLETLGAVNYGIEKIRSEEGKVEGSKFRYLFESYDSRTMPNFLKFGTLTEKRDKELLERKKGNLEDYVANIYAK